VKRSEAEAQNPSMLFSTLLLPYRAKPDAPEGGNDKKVKGNGI
jgi:hypothetical protein